MQGVEDTSDALEDEAAKEDLEGDKEELFKEAKQKAAEGAEKVESAASNGVEEAKSAASHGAENAKSAAGEGARKGHKLCKWSWAQRRCTPTDLCQYKYQVRCRSYSIGRLRVGREKGRRLCSGFLDSVVNQSRSSTRALVTPALSAFHASVACTVVL